MKIWFKAKRYGYGWVPVTWEGWLVLFLYIAFNFWNFRRLDAVSHSNSDTIRPFVIWVFFSTFFLISICYKRGEKPGWRWGK
jgi:hypothetical protein